jgi:hypothetical protein
MDILPGFRLGFQSAGMAASVLQLNGGCKASLLTEFPLTGGSALAKLLS